MISFLVWWCFGFFGSVIGMTYMDAGSAIGWLNVIGGFVWWLLMVQLWPFRPCTGACRGKGKLGDWAQATYWRNCPDCGGSGRQFRLFVMPNHPLKMAARKARASG